MNKVSKKRKRVIRNSRNFELLIRFKDRFDKFEV